MESNRPYMFLPHSFHRAQGRGESPSGQRSDRRPASMSDLARSEEKGNRGALDGVRVLDLTHQVAGPSATLMLAFLGAEVVKVIAPGSRDSYDSIAFYLNHASKKSIELDLKSEAGVQAALRL